MSLDLNPPHWLGAGSAAAFADRARLAGHSVPAYAVQLAADDIGRGSLIPCRTCGDRWPASLIDSKPEPDDPAGEDADFTFFQCPVDYGPNWSPL